MIMISPGSFPTIWPSPQHVTLKITSGRVSLPTFDQMKIDAGGEMFARTDMIPRLGPGKNIVTTRQGHFSRELSYSLSDNKRSISVKTDEGCKYFPDVDTEIDEVTEDVYTIACDDPLSAEAYCYRTCIITYQVSLKIKYFFKVPKSNFDRRELVLQLKRKQQPKVG